MKYISIIIPLFVIVAASAQPLADTTDIFDKHLKLNEIVITGVVGEAKPTESPQPVNLINTRTLNQTASLNIIDAIAKQPGMSQLTTGGAVSKPVIRGLGGNRVVVVYDGIRQESQQWGDEHGVEIDAADIGSVEIVKGPASLQYGSDALAGVLVLHSQKLPLPEEIKGGIVAQYHTNNGLINYSLNMAGNKSGFIFDLRYSEKYAHAYRNKFDGYVPNTQFNERAASAKLGINKKWGYSFLKMTFYNINPSLPEGERDSTGNLIAENGKVKTYKHGLPYQRIFHYKVQSENEINLSAGYLKIVAGYQQNRRNEFEESPTTAGLRLQLHTATADIRYIYAPEKRWKVSTGISAMYQTSLNKGNEFLIPDY
ncbi:MAG: TonB-dependent receptor plug domain-containing protein, partial [Bacteroidales bacterium]|nr:TonB-dependent receptor plug domain-containing protein [Bacteroidales bacterium]